MAAVAEADARGDAPARVEAEARHAATEDEFAAAPATSMARAVTKLCLAIGVDPDDEPHLDDRIAAALGDIERLAKG